MSSSPPPALIRLQVLTPLSVLISLGANLVGTLAIKPGAGQINDEYLTILTPRKSLIGFYWLILYVLQICYCVLLVLARKEETKATLIRDVGLRFPFVNLLMALWVIFWDLKLFLGSEVVLLVNLFLLATICLTLLQHPPTLSRPLDFAFIHLPMRMFLLVLLNVDIWQNGLLAFSWYKYIGDDPSQGPGKWEPDHRNHAWIAFGVMIAVGIFDAAVVFVARDFTWALATVYLFLSILLKGSKPAQIFIPLILLCILQLVSLLASVLWYRYGGARAGRIRLQEDSESAAVPGEGAHAAGRHPQEGFVAQGLPDSGT